MRLRAMRFLAVLVTLGAVASGAEIPAFPGAEGFGARTPGGRGGVVKEVTNLNDKGPGSLRAALDADGPRIVVFRVSGNIELKSNLTIRKPFVTIAGQSAPGDGICLKNHQLSVATHDVVIRYLRFRPGDVSGDDLDAVGGRDCADLIVDHCSASWSIDECLSFYNNKRTTVQWCLVAESLYHSNHVKGNHGYGGIWGGDQATFHHNLIAHHSSRNPRFAADSHDVDFRNNLIFNWGFQSIYGGERSTVNMVANDFKPGPATKKGVTARLLDGSGVGSRWFLADNVMEGAPAVTANNWAGVQRAYAPEATVKADKPFPAAPVATRPAGQAAELVLAEAGANLPKRDAVDTRIVADVRAGRSAHGGTFGPNTGLIDSQTEVGGWPTLNTAEPPPDRDHDGMPDAWETRHGLDPGNPRDGALDADGDGYTNVEEYLNATDPQVAVDYRQASNNTHSLHLGR